MDLRVLQHKCRMRASREFLDIEKRAILEEYEFLVGHRGSEALCDALSALLGGQRVVLETCKQQLKLGTSRKILRVHVDRDYRIYDLMFS